MGASLGLPGGPKYLDISFVMADYMLYIHRSETYDVKLTVIITGIIQTECKFLHVRR